MNIIFNDEDTQHLDGWQEIYTDFDGWICKFSKYRLRRSSQIHSPMEVNEDASKSNNQIKTKPDRRLVSIQDLIVEGFILRKLNGTNQSRDTIKNELSHFLNVAKNDEIFINYDYILTKLMNGDGRYFYQYTRSKLLIVFY